jgi:hypothetical protein
MIDLKPVDDPVYSKAAEGNTACRAEALEAKAGTLKPALEAARHALGQEPLLALSHEKLIGHTCYEITDHFRR